MWDLSSLTRDRTCFSCTGRWILYHFTREVPWVVGLKKLSVSQFRSGCCCELHTCCWAPHLSDDSGQHKFIISLLALISFPGSLCFDSFSRALTAGCFTLWGFKVILSNSVCICSRLSKDWLYHRFLPSCDLGSVWPWANHHNLFEPHFFPVITLILLGGAVSVKWDKEHICHTESIWLLFVKSPSHVWLFCNPMDCSPPNSSVHGISQVRILEWVAISFSRGSSQPRDWPCISCIGRRILYRWATREAQACSRHMGNAARSKGCPVGESTPRRSIPLCWNPASCRYFML